MRGKVVVDHLWKYLVILVQVIVFPLAWIRSFRFAAAFRESAPRGTQMVAGAIVLGVAFTAVGAYVLVDLHRDSTDGFYDQLEGRLSLSTGESEYQSELEAIAISESLLTSFEERRDEAAAAGDEDMETEWQGKVDDERKTLATARENRDALSPNHDLFLLLQVEVRQRDDAGAKRLVETSPALDADRREASMTAFAIKDDAVADFWQAMYWILIPGLIGVFYGPLVVALGRIYKQGFVPSESIGYKPYPGTSMGLFLLLGGFGVPALFFAAWAFKDLDQRLAEGQFSL